MREYMNDVGRGIPAMIEISKHYKHKGSPLYSRWYGYFDMQTSLWDKVKMLVNNGK